MMKEERQQLIMNELYEKGRVSVEELASAFHTSKDTIRRDLSELEEQGILKRTYGGAIPHKRLPAAIDSRFHVEKKEKYQVALKAAKYVRPDTLIAIDGGTTNVLLASLLPLSLKLKVVTNSFPVAEELHRHPNTDVFFVGGHCNKESRTACGDASLAYLKGYYFDQCFIGAYAIDSRIGITVPSPYEDEAELKRCIVRSSREVNILAASSKLDKVSNYVICQVQDADRIITDFTPDTETAARYQDRLV